MSGILFFIFASCHPLRLEILYKKVWTNIRHIVPGKTKNTDILCVKAGSKDVADALNQYTNVGPNIADKIPDLEGINNYVDVNTAEEMLFFFYF